MSIKGLDFGKVYPMTTLPAEPTLLETAEPPSRGRTLDDLLCNLQQHTEDLEKGEFSGLKCKAFKHTRKNLTQILLQLQSLQEKVEDPRCPLLELQRGWLDLLAAEQTLLNFVETMKEVVEAYGYGERLEQIKAVFQSVPIDLAKQAEPASGAWQKTSSAFQYIATRFLFPPLFLYDCAQTLKETISEEGQKEATRRHFFSKMAHLVNELKSFSPSPSTDKKKQAAFERRASQLEQETAKGDLSSGTKKLIHSLFTLLQLSSHCIEASKREPIASLIQKEARKQPFSLSREQEEEVSFVGKVLFDKRKYLSTMSEDSFQRLTQRYPNTRSFLSLFRGENISPMEEEIPHLQQLYRERLVKHRPWIDLAGAFGSASRSSAPSSDEEPKGAPAPRRGNEISGSSTHLSPIAARETPMARWLATEDFSLDASLFAHILGESFSKNSVYEGSSRIKMLQFLKGVHAQRLSFAPGEVKSEKLIAQYDKAIALLYAFANSPEQLNALLQQELTHLPKGDGFFFQAKTKDHAFVLEFQKKQDGHFNLRIYNTDEASYTYHSKELRLDQSYKNRYFEISDIPAKNINLAFCHFLVSISNQEIEEGFYNAFHAILKHSSDKKQVEQMQFQPQKAESLVLTKQAGFCAYLSVMDWEYDQNPSHFPRMHLEMAAKAYVSFRNQADLQRLENRRLLNKGGEQLAVFAQSAYEKGVITREEWALIQQEIRPVSLEVSEAVHSVVLQAKPYIANVSPPETESFEKLGNPRGKPLDLLLLPPLSSSPEDFLKETKIWRERLTSEINKNGEIVPAAILEWVEQIPFPIQKEWLDAFSPTQALDLLHLLKDIGEDYLYCQLIHGGKRSREKGAGPRGSLAMIKLLTIGRELSLRSIGEGGVFLPHLYQKNMDLLLEGTSSAQHLFNPDLEDQLRAMRDYWRKEEPLSTRPPVSFFAFDTTKATNAGWGGLIGTRFHFLTPKDEELCNHPYCRITWEDIQWITEYFNTPEIAIRVAQDPVLQNLTPLERVKTALEKKHPLLPSAFHDLFALSFLVEAIPSVPYLEFAEDSLREKGVGVKFDFNKEEIDKEQMSYFYSHNKAFRMSLNTELPYCSYKVQAEELPQIDTNYALTLSQDRLPLSSEGLYHMQEWMEPCVAFGWTRSNYRRHVPPAYRMLEFPGQPPQSIGDYTKFQRQEPKKEYPHQILAGQAVEKEVQELREKLALSALPSLQIRETLAYYSSHPQLLEKREEQIFFKKLMFEPPLLIEFLLEHPEEASSFTARFDEFAQKGFQTYKDLGHPLAASFYLEILEKWERTLTYLNKMHPEILFRRAFPLQIDPAKELGSLIQKNLHHPEQAVFLHLDRALLFKPEDLNEHTIIDFLETLFQLEIVPWPRKFYQDFDLPFGPGRLNNGLWHPIQNPDYPHEKAHLLKDHLLRCRAPLQKLLEGPAREEILNTLMQRLIPSFRTTKWKADPQFPYFKSDSQEIYLDVLQGRLYEDGKSTKPLPRELLDHVEMIPYLPREGSCTAFEIKPGVYEFTSIDQEKMRVFFRKIQKEKREEKKLVIQKLIEGKWTEKVDSFAPLPGYFQTRGPEIPRDFWLAVKAEHQTQDLWIDNQWHAKVTEGKISEVRDLKTGWELGDLDPQSLFTRVEGRGFILPWLDPQTKELKQVDLPQLHLQFKADQGTFSSVEFEGYQVSAQQTIPALGHLKNYVVLEKGDRRLVLMPQYFREVSPRNDLKATAPFKMSPAPLLVFSVDPSGALSPQNRAARLYLSYVFLTEHRYEESLEWLKGTGSKIEPLGTSEKEILSWMVSKDKIQQDSDPRAVAIRVKAQLLWMEDKQTFSSSEEISYLNLHYNDLVQLWDRTPPRFFPTAEEETLLSRFIDSASFNLAHESLPQTLPISLPKPIESHLQQTKRILGYVEDYYHLFKCQEYYEIIQAALRGRPDDPNLPHLEPSYFVQAKDWSQDMILSIYSCMQKREEEDIRFVHKALFGESNLVRPEPELLEEIVQSFKATLFSHSNPKERALAALFVALYEHASDFPSHEKFAEVFELKEEDYSNGPFHFRLVMKTRLNPFVSEHLMGPVEKYCLPLLEMSPPHPAQILSTRQKESLPVFWNAQSTHLRSSLTAPEMPLEASFTTEMTSPFTKAHRELLQAFPSDKEMRKRLKQFIASPKAKNVHYQTQQLEKITEDSRQALMATRQKEELLAEELLKTANKLEKDPTQRLYQTGAYLTDFDKPIELPELLKFFLTQDASALQVRNPALSMAECHALIRKTQAYLVTATQRQHFERIFKKASAAKQSEGSEREKWIQDLAVEGSQKRAYSPHQNPECLMIEHANQIRLRPEQIEAIRQFKPGTAQEAIMGFGKTLVLLPLLAFKAADGEKLSLIVMPKDLLPSMSQALDKTLGKAFGQSLEVFSFDRNMSVSFGFLENTYRRLQQAIEKRKVVAMSSADLQSFFLMAIEAIHDRSPLADAYRKILICMKSSGHLILDEMHLLLDVFHSHHFSAGEKQSLASSEVEGAALLYPMLSSLGWDGSSSISKAEYESQWKERLIQEALKRPEFSSYSSKKLRAYLLEKPQAQKYVDQIPFKAVKNLLATFKEQIQRVLPLVLHREIGEHFGALPKDKVPLGQSKWMAIPYHGSQNPAIGSQFGSNLEVLDYTLRLHLSKGIEMEVLEKELEQLQVKIGAEKIDLELDSARETPSYKRFLQLAGTDRYSIYTLSQAEKEAILKNINQSIPFKTDLIRNWILPELYRYPLQLYTSGHTFGDLVSSIRGFSGTNWNEQTFPAHFTSRISSDTQSYTLHLLQSKKEPLILAKDPADLIEQSEGKPIIDRGAVFKEFENRQMARRLLEHSDAKGIVFYEDNQLKVYLKAQSDPVSYANCPLPKEDLIVYWDQKHTTGSDIPLGLESQAITTVGRHTHLFELLQAVWRMRGLGRRQNVQMALLESEATYIQEFLHRETNRSLNDPLRLEDLLKYTWLKEQEKQKEHSVRALKFKLADVLIGPLLDQICDLGSPLPEPKVLEEFFYLKEPNDPWDLYGRMATSVPKKEYAEQLMHHFLQKSWFQKLSVYQQEALKAELQAIVEKELPHLPDQISSPSATYGREVQTQVQVEAEQQKLTEVEQQKELEKVLVENQPRYAPRGIISWEGTLEPADFIPSEASHLAGVTLVQSSDLLYPLQNFKDQGFTPVVRIQDALALHGIPSVFDPSLLASSTFMPLQKEMSSQEVPVYPFTPLGKFQDGVREMLVIQDVKTEEFKLMLLSQNEAEQFEKRLSQERAAVENGVRLALYQPGYGLYAQGPDFLTAEQLKEHTQFQLLIAQAKLFNGDVSYAREEVRALEGWFTDLKQKGQLHTVKDLFENQILAWKRISAREYPQSTLYRCFQRVLNPKINHR